MQGMFESTLLMSLLMRMMAIEADQVQKLSTWQQTAPTGQLAASDYHPHDGDGDDDVDDNHDDEVDIDDDHDDDLAAFFSLFWRISLLQRYITLIFSSATSSSVTCSVSWLVGRDSNQRRFEACELV